MRKSLMIGLLASGALGGWLAAAHAQGQAPAQTAARDTQEVARCTALASTHPLAPATATAMTAHWVAADAATALPGYCELKATLSPVPGSAIGVVYRLPADWNGKLLGLGGGGWAGNVTLERAAPGLKAGYATAQTDGGHPGAGPWDTSWTARPQAVVDFSYRAVNRMTVAGKALVQAYYGQPQKRAYFQGCSTGGRMAMMEAQRFPQDYDGIIAGAPVYSLQVQTTAVLRNDAFARPGAAFSPAQLKLVNDAVLKACDAKDGLADGIINDPRRCTWKPEVLLCKPGQSAGASCLSQTQVTTLDTAYDGIRTPDGSWAQFPLLRGGELGWSLFIATGGGSEQSGGGGLPGIAHLLFGDHPADLARLNPATDVPRARSSAFAKMYEAADPDLSAFFARDGKLLLWQGLSDPGPSPVGTIDYARAVDQADGDAARQAMRLFLLPGVEHCAGGPGPDQVDTLTALDQWVTQDKAPETLVAHKANSAMTRLLCAWPGVAQYKGSGDVNAPASWHCEAPDAK